MDKKNILGLDIGEKRIGVALSDGLGMLAHPLTTIYYKNLPGLIRDLNEIIQARQIVTMVVGVPYTMRGTHSQKTGQILELITHLREELDVEIIGIDERLTTKMAEGALHALGKKPSRQRNKIDQIAAVYILQSFLDKTTN